MECKTKYVRMDAVFLHICVNEMDVKSAVN